MKSVPTPRTKSKESSSRRIFEKIKKLDPSIMRKAIVFFLILFVDFCSKYWVSHTLPLIQPYLGFPFGGVGVLDTTLLKISIVHMTNTGTAWGLFSDYPQILLLFRIAITAAVLSYLIFMKPAKNIQVPLACIAAGAVGNIIDYFHYGHVIDFMYCIFYHYSYPIFNVADSAIFCSVLYLFITSKKIKLRHHASSS